MNLTILIKTFKRPEICQRLIDSIRKYYRDVQIFVVVDDYDTSLDKVDRLIIMPFDSGVSAGRNKLVEMCRTKYCLILDDDCVFTEQTDLEKAIKILEEKDLDILELKTKTDYKGLFDIKDNIVRYVRGNRDGLYDFVTNIFVAKTEKLKEYQWDERLKIGEHFAYFYKHLGKMKIGSTDEVAMEHLSCRPEGYREYRERGMGYVYQFMRENGIKKIIDFYVTNIEL